MSLARRQTEKSGAQLVKAQAVAVDKTAEGFVVQTEDGARHVEMEILLATGA